MSLDKPKKDLPEIILGPSEKICIQNSPVHGKGVFAREDILERELIEEGKLLRLELRYNLINDPVLKDYIFIDSDNTHPDYGSAVYFGIGYLNLYNHQDEPNTHSKLNFKKEIMTITAKRDIKAGEEIFISYGSNYFKFRHIYANLNEKVRMKIH